MKLVQLNAHHIPCHQHCRWVRSQNCGCLVTWFCYQLIAKPGNKTAAVPWPDPDTDGLVQIGVWWIYIFSPCVELLKVGHEGMWVQFGNQTLIALKWHSCYSGMHYNNTWLYCCFARNILRIWKFLAFLQGLISLWFFTHKSNLMEIPFCNSKNVEYMVKW